MRGVNDLCLVSWDPMPRLAVPIVVAAILAGCSANAATGQAIPRQPDPTVTSTTPAGSPPSTPVDSEGCIGREPLVEEGLIGAFTEPSDAALLSSITWENRGSCEVFILRFETANGAPATTPPGFAALLRRGVGVLRIELDIEESLITQQLAESRFVSSIYVPTDDADSRFVELMLAGETLARVNTLRSPGMIELQLHPGGPPLGASPTVGDDIVVVSPTPGGLDGPTVPVSGYTTGSEVRIMGGDEADITLHLREDIEGAQPWTVFETELDLPTGPGIIEVIPSRDAEPLVGVEIEVNVR